MNAFLKQVVVVLMLIAIGGATFFCLFMAIPPIFHNMSSMHESHYGFLAHFLHAKELTLTIVGTAFSSLILFLMIAVFVSFSFFKTNFFLQLAVGNHELRKRRDILYISKQTIHNWLSLFELSPNY